VTITTSLNFTTFQKGVPVKLNKKISPNHLKIKKEVRTFAVPKNCPSCWRA